MSIHRTYSSDLVRRGTDQILDEIKDRFDADDWLADTKNVALVNSSGDVALFEEHGSPGVYKGHYFFLSRGKDAVVAAREFMTYFFERWPVTILMGFTQKSKKGAMWLSRHLGFIPVSDERINGDDYQVWAMHKKDFKCQVF